MARVGVVGGSGHMGRRAARALAEVGHDVVTADLRPPVDGSTEFRFADANDHESLISAMEDVDIVVNFVGPFYRYGTRVAEAALRARRPYVDICDDADVTEQLLTLDQPARDAGIPMIIGAGMSPGVLNAIVQSAVSDFDKVDEVLTAWVIDERTESGPAPLDHFFHGISSEIPIWLDGRRQMIRPFTEESIEEFPFPDPMGVVELRDIGHPEPVTLPRVIDAAAVRNKGALLPAYSAEIFSMLRSIGLLSDTEVHVGGSVVRARDFIVSYLTARHNEKVRPDSEDLSAMGVRVKGRRAGKDALRHVTFGGALSMSDSTSLPAVAAAELVADGLVEAGVHGPEVLGPQRWFERIVVHAGDLLDGIEVWDGDDRSQGRLMTLLECSELGTGGSP